MNTYYQNCPFPKPISKKRKKKVNGYKDKPDRVCFYEIQDNITEWAQKQNRIWRKFFQTKYEIELMREGLSPERAREAWISLIGRNYL